MFCDRELSVTAMATGAVPLSLLFCNVLVSLALSDVRQPPLMRLRQTCRL